MDEEKLTEQAGSAPAAQTPGPAEPAPAPELVPAPELAPAQSPKTEKDPLFASVYERLPNIPLKALDIFIGVCVAALVLVLAVGFVQSRT